MEEIPEEYKMVFLTWVVVNAPSAFLAMSILKSPYFLSPMIQVFGAISIIACLMLSTLMMIYVVISLFRKGR